ncbi:hypothetical protein L6164_002687 [Bauhinia variegata]|uniref:Uncharacterized protein n=1 Tax=Bauhinia variegata TaxID=167791 RepID=A0ACB9PY57_BAUVA|nr:hypothetical protein L6164_002687 [Bauhinia variegata]
MGGPQELLAIKSTKMAILLKKNSKDDISEVLRHITSAPEIFELLVQFCCGGEIHISPDNIISLTYLANLLEMTETHSKNNLLSKVLTFFEQRVLSHWNETIKALRSIDNLQQTKEIGLFDACLASIVEKVKLNPRLLGEPLNTSDRSEADDNAYRPNARRKLFVLDWESEDLTTLCIQLYEPIVHELNACGVPHEYVTASLVKYVEKWVLPACEKKSIFKRNNPREVIEAVERLLSHENRVFPCSLLVGMLRFSILLGATSDCTNGLEERIGQQLEHATVNDLILIPRQGNVEEEAQFNVDCLRRILKSFYRNYNSSEESGLLTVAELMEEFLAEISSNLEMRPRSFISLAELTMASSFGIKRNCDGIYRALDIYLDKHRDMTESEREEVCQVLDCQKISPEALEHAAKNERLPLRVVVQVLFVGQLHLQEKMTTEIQAIDQKLREDQDVGSGHEVEENEVEIVNKKVSELERESHSLRKEIEKCHNARKEKVSVWGRMKRKFGCISSIHELNSRVNKKKVHP